MRRVRYHATFRDDLHAQVGWLATNREVEWLEGLRAGLDEVVAVLAALPKSGVLEARRGNSELRQLVLRRVPYVVWYSCGARSGDVWLLRLFHARQRRPRPSWPKVGRGG